MRDSSLFIGGPADSQFLKTDGARIWSMTRPVEFETIKYPVDVEPVPVYSDIDIVRYQRVTFAGGELWVELYIFLEDDREIPDEQAAAIALAKLIGGYSGYGENDA